MPGASVLFFAGLFAADPVFVDSASVKVEGDSVTMQIVGEKAIDPTAVSGRITPEGVGIYIEGGMGRPTNLQWQSNGLTIDARRRKDKVKMEMAFPTGTACTGPVKVRGTDGGKIEAEFKCTAAVGVVAGAAPTVAADSKVAEAIPTAEVESTTAPELPSQKPQAVAPATTAPSNRWMWLVGAQALLIIVLLFRRKPVPVQEPTVRPGSRFPVSGDPVKVLIVAEMEGRHFLLGATDSNTGMVRDATAQWADQRAVTEVLLTPIGGARSNRNTSSAISESAEARLAAKIFGPSGR